MFMRKLLNLNLNRNNLNISNAVQENKGYRPIYYTKRTMLFKGVKAIGQSTLGSGTDAKGEGVQRLSVECICVSQQL